MKDLCLRQIFVCLSLFIKRWLQSFRQITRRHFIFYDSSPAFNKRCLPFCKAWRASFRLLNFSGADRRKRILTMVPMRMLTKSWSEIVSPALAGILLEKESLRLNVKVIKFSRSLQSRSFKDPLRLVSKQCDGLLSVKCPIHNSKLFQMLPKLKVPMKVFREFRWRSIEV